jgi:predicted dehydrogenase
MPMAGVLVAGGGELAPALEFSGLGYGPAMALVRHFLDAVAEGTVEPRSWQGQGPLPSHEDGLRQVQVVAAIIASAETGRVVPVG